MAPNRKFGCTSECLGGWPLVEFVTEGPDVNPTVRYCKQHMCNPGHIKTGTRKFIFFDLIGPMGSTGKGVTSPLLVFTGDCLLT